MEVLKNSDHILSADIGKLFMSTAEFLKDLELGI